jgi:hypothetical protein
MDTVASLWLAGIGLLALSIFNMSLIFKLIPAYKKCRKVLDTPRSLSADIHGGLVSVEGEVEPFEDDINVSPIGGTNCVLYRTVIEEKQIGAEGYLQDKINMDRREGYSFVVKDESGRTRVLTAGADLDILVAIDYQVGDKNHLSHLVHQGLKRYGIRATRGLRVKEDVLRSGDMVYVLGTAVKKGMRSEYQNDATISQFTIVKGDTLIISTKNKYHIHNKLKKIARNQFIKIIFGNILFIFAFFWIIVFLYGP